MTLQFRLRRVLSFSPSRSRTAGKRLAVGLLTAVVAACGSDAPKNPVMATPTVTQVTVTGTTPSVGATSQFTATATISDGTTRNVTGESSWTSSNQGIAVVSGTGTVAAMSSGEVTITATYQQRSGNMPIVIPSPAPSVHTVTGVVTDSKAGYELDRVEVRVTSGANQGQSAVTDALGRYTLSGLAGGTMTVRATATQSTWTFLERTITVPGDSVLDFALPRASSPDPTPDPEPPSTGFGTGAFITIVTNSITCECSEGTIEVKANGKRLGTTSCAPKTRRFEVGPAKYTLRACDDLGCWEDLEETLATGDEWEILLTCADAALSAQPLSGEGTKRASRCTVNAVLKRSTAVP
jgi:hypothetical protein